MDSQIKIIGVTSILIIFLASPILALQAYDDVHGVEYDDVIEIAFSRRINDDFYENEYTIENPFELTVNENYINVVFVNALIGMKVGEVKPSIEWSVTDEYGLETEYEYIDTTIVSIVRDATPNTTPIGKIFLYIFEAILAVGVVIGAFYLYIKVIKPKFLTKKCLECGNLATSKCSKCGTHICTDCSVKGCPNCGCKKYIRL